MTEKDGNKLSQSRRQEDLRKADQKRLEKMTKIAIDTYKEAIKELEKH